MLVLNAADVLRLLPLDDCIAAVEAAFLEHGQTGVLSAHAGPGAFHIKTAFVGRRFGAKANANFPENPHERGLPAIQGLMLLFDAGDGRPLAVLDSIEITAPVEAFKAIGDMLRANGIKTDEAGLRMIPNTTVELPPDHALQVMRTMEAIEELDDTQQVFSTLHVSDEAVALLETA